MRNILLTLISITLLSSACSEDIITSDLNMYEQEAAAYLGIKSLYVPVYLSSDLDEGLKGVCRYKKHSLRGISIEIDRDNWLIADHNERIAIMVHEMLHCYKGVGHVVNFLDKEDKLMSPHTHDSSNCIRKYGLEYCIEETYDMVRDGIVEDMYK